MGSFGWEAHTFRTTMKLFTFALMMIMLQDLNFYVKAAEEEPQNDFQKISRAWRSTLMENLPIIANFSSMVMRTPSTSYLANQNFTYKSYVLRRFKPLLPNEETFEDMFTTMTKENNCESNEPPVVMNDLVNNFIFRNSLRDWHRAECLRKNNLQEAFFKIDKFYEYTYENFEDFCSNPRRAERVMETKLRQFVQALQLTDAIITAILEDLSRSPNSISKPLEYETHFDETKQFLASKFISRIQKQVLDKPCPKPDSSRQLDMLVGSRPSRPYGTRQGQLSRSAKDVDYFLKKSFNRKNP